MILLSSWSRASKKMPHSWMTLMVDECAAMAPPHIPTFVRSTFKSSGVAPAKGCSGSPMNSSSCDCTQSSAGVHHTCLSASSAVTMASTFVSSSSASEVPARAHEWAAVVRLLCEGGDWVRAVAVVDGLPSALQQSTRHKAVRDEWPLPRSVKELWRRTSIPWAAAASSIPGMTPLPPGIARCAAGFPQSSAPQSRETLASCRTADLVRIAYSLSRPRVADVAVAAPAGQLPAPPQTLKSEQQMIVAELRRRGAVLEVVQCVVNWQRRQLASPDVEDATNATSGGTRDDILDGVKVVKTALFPFVPTCGAGSDACQSSGVSAAPRSVFEPWSGRMSGRPPLYTSAHLQVIRQVAASHPIILARCLRDRTVVDRLVCHAGEAVVAEVVLLLMEHIASLVSGRAERRPPAKTPVEEDGRVEVALSEKLAASVFLSRSRLGNRSATWTNGPAPSILSQGGLKLTPTEAFTAAEACWRALAALLFSLHPYIYGQPKTGKEKLLAALISALDETTRVFAVDCPRPGLTLNSPEHSSSGTRPAEGSAIPQRGGRVPGVLSDKVRHAIKAAVESVCSPLLSHEPQVRFIRLPTFGQVASLLRALDVPVPNALAQCLFLCMADAVAPSLEGGASNASSDYVAQYLSSAPSSRWVHALAMVDTAHRESAYRVSPAHERAILSGLQSISIAQTWTSALRTVSVFKESYSLMPDERTLPTLLLNLKQQSWQDAFRVLQYVPGGDADRSSPSVLRDLQLVALKHASWVVPLRLMTHLQRCRADGFMSYLYCLCSAARSGNAQLAFEFFLSLKHGRGRHAALKRLSPYNELTVAVAAVAMLDYGQAEALIAFSTRVVAMCTATDTAGQAPEAGTAVDSENALLTVDGLQMAQAAQACALLALRRHEALTLFLNECAATSLSALLRRVILLYCLSGLDHLRAPVRLIFDVVGHQGSALQRNEVLPSQEANQSPIREFLVAVAADQKHAGTFETRQRGTAGRRQHLYIAMTHQRRQKKALAAALGMFMRDQEGALSPNISRLVAQSMVEEGVGAEYLSAALL
ncbi:hypothetical protein JKF63_05227 [Porcisia hertigi]|uniref:Uncharacterized protein n=1 Tax=Porcisia hertigi TaxID=2761500 RepID=A0A836LE59_9TRYP|nr:hypothetical protein JKF63_05227 [Porcisia hertigi]